MEVCGFRSVHHSPITSITFFFSGEATFRGWESRHRLEGAANPHGNLASTHWWNEVEENRESISDRIRKEVEDGGKFSIQNFFGGRQ